MLTALSLLPSTTKNWLVTSSGCFHYHWAYTEISPNALKRCSLRTNPCLERLLGLKFKLDHKWNWCIRYIAKDAINIYNKITFIGRYFRGFFGGGLNFKMIWNGLVFVYLVLINCPRHKYLWRSQLLPRIGQVRLFVFHFVSDGYISRICLGIWRNGSEENCLKSKHGTWYYNTDFKQWKTEFFWHVKSLICGRIIMYTFSSILRIQTGLEARQTGRDTHTHAVAHPHEEMNQYSLEFLFNPCWAHRSRFQVADF